MMKYLALLLFLPLTCWSQEILLWKTVNTVSSSLVPVYEGQESPFPHITEVEEVSPTLNAEAEAERLARLQALTHAEQLVSGKNAFRPEIGSIRIDGRIDGLAGSKILIANQWIGEGRQLQVRLSRTPEADSAIEELRKYDADAAATLDARLNQRMQENPTLSLTIKGIKSKEVQLDSEYGKYLIPIAQSSEY
jgi:hypothetical protein